METKEIKPDECELLLFFVNHEIENYKKQLDWYKKYEPKKEAINDIPVYISRLELLRNKLDVKHAEGEEQ